jgi:hypothetical protein
MGMIRSGLSVAALMCMAPQCLAVFSTGNEMLDSCSAAVRSTDERLDGVNSIKAGYCMGYLAGFVDSYDVGVYTGAKEVACIPKTVNNGQLARVLVKWLKENPTQLHRNPRILVYSALVDGFPCAAKK